MIVGGTPTISDVNSTTTPLNNGQTFTGEWIKVFHYSSVLTAVLTDADGTLKMQFSPDGVNADSTLSYQVVAGSNDVHRLTITRGYYRTVFENDGGSNQSYMRLQTLLGHQTSLASPLNGTIAQDADALVTRAIPVEAEIAAGRVDGMEIVEKFGYNLDVDTATVPEDVWGPGGVYTGFPTGDPDTIDVSSSSTDDDLGGSGLEIIRLYGLDANWNQITEDVTLNGTTKVTTTNTWRRLYRIIGLQSNNGANDSFNAGIITTEYTNDAAVIFTKIPVGLNQTVLGGYTVPANRILILQSVQVEMARSASATATGALWVRWNGGVPRLTQYFTISQNAQFLLTGNYIYPEKTDLIVRITSVSTNSIGFTTQFSGLLIEKENQ